MGATPRFALRWPENGDAPDLSAIGLAIATDVEAKLSAVLECTDAARPTGIPNGFMISVTDLGTLEIRRAGAWVVIGSSGGGGTGYTAVAGQYYASSAQSISNNTDTVVAFGTTEVASAIVTRTVTGAGHEFTLSEAGCYDVDLTVRFAAGAAGSRFVGLQQSTTSRLAAQQNEGGPSAATRHISVTRRFAAGTALRVIAAQNSGSSLLLEPVGGSAPTDGFVRINITKTGP